MSIRYRALALVALLPWSPLRADGGFFSPMDHSGADLREPCQRAIIVYRGNEETLVLSVDYQGDATEFAWVIPTPSVAVVKLAPEELLGEVAKYYHRLELAAWKEEARKLAWGMGAGGAGPGGEEDVVVHSRRLVGPYDISVLSATGENALLGWLTQNRYRVSAVAEPILAGYVAKGWHFAAIRVQTSPGEGQALPPIRLDFRASAPTYPLRISAINPGLADIRIYCFWEMPEAAEARRAAGGSRRPYYRVDPKIRERCPKLFREVAGVPWERLVLARIAEELPPQVLAKLGDELYLEASPRGWLQPALHPPRGAAMATGIAEALLSDLPDERKWAEDHLPYYYYAYRRPGDLLLPLELAELTSSKRSALRDMLMAFVRDNLHRDQNCQGAAVLLTSIADPADPGVIEFFESTVPDSRLGGGGEGLQRLASPESRRALFRIAMKRGSASESAARCYVLSLDAAEVAAMERRLACGELYVLLSEGIAEGDAETRGLGLLRMYCGQDFAGNWSAWGKWLRESMPEYWLDGGGAQPPPTGK